MLLKSPSLVSVCMQFCLRSVQQHQNIQHAQHTFIQITLQFIVNLFFITITFDYHRFKIVFINITCIYYAYNYSVHCALISKYLFIHFSCEIGFYRDRYTFGFKITHTDWLLLFVWRHIYNPPSDKRGIYRILHIIYFYRYNTFWCIYFY